MYIRKLNSTLSPFFPSACLSTFISAAPAVRIFVKLDIADFYEKSLNLPHLVEIGQNILGT
jgi:hypothetical protein